MLPDGNLRITKVDKDHAGYYSCDKYEHDYSGKGAYIPTKKTDGEIILVVVEDSKVQNFVLNS